MASPKKLVIFDCDGVLVDSEPHSIAVLVKVMGDLGIAIDEAGAYERFLGRSLAAVTDYMRDDHGLTVGEDFIQNIRTDLFARFRAELKPIPGIEEALDGLRQPRCVASSSQLERIRLSLSVTGLSERLEPHIFSAQMVKNGKPAPDLFLHAAAEMGVAPADCVVIEDSPAGIQAAKAGDMTVFAFTGGSHTTARAAYRSEIEALSPDLIFDRMADLPGLLR